MGNKKIYTFSFTGASALIVETLVVAEELNRLQDWGATEASLVRHNLLNKVKAATFKREFQEIKKRLALLSSKQLEVLVQGDLEEAKAIVLLSLAKTYAIFRDFVIEVVRYKYLLFDRMLSESDYTRFYNAKSLEHPELEALSEATTKKVKQRMFTLLEQVGLISQTKDGIIQKPFLSTQVVEAIIEDDPALLSIFLCSAEEVRMMMQNLNHA